MLRKSGIEVDKLNNHQQVVLHNELIKRIKRNQCTYKQAKLLKKFGYRTDVSFKEASDKITRLASNGWRRI
jgi:hypothetical protein